MAYGHAGTHYGFFSFLSSSNWYWSRFNIQIKLTLAINGPHYWMDSNSGRLALREWEFGESVNGMWKCRPEVDWSEWVQKSECDRGKMEAPKDVQRRSELICVDRLYYFIQAMLLMHTKWMDAAWQSIDGDRHNITQLTPYHYGWQYDALFHY